MSVKLPDVFSGLLGPGVGHAAATRIGEADSESELSRDRQEGESTVAAITMVNYFHRQENLVRDVMQAYNPVIPTSCFGHLSVLMGLYLE